MRDDRDEDLLAQADLPRRRGRRGAGKAETGRATKAEGQRAAKGETGPYRRLSGQRYADFLAALHQAMTFDWYLEIGCRAGRTFAPVRGNTIAVDPFFKAEGNIISAKRRLFVFQETSDEFYSHGFLKKNGIELSFSFLDGMHLFEFLLRDFMNTEANSTPDGVIAMHDCVPFHAGMLTRDLEQEQQAAQEMFPHYFEKQKTDGVDHQIYVGASLVEGGRFDPLYLKNLRLWQLMVACGAARCASSIASIMSTVNAVGTT